MSLTNIVAAVGGFPQDDAVVARALDLVTTSGAVLTVVHVIDLAGCDIGADDSLLGEAALAARDRVEAALRRNGADISDIEIRIEVGSPALKLIEFCQANRPDLVVMRAHQKSRIIERILGSTPDRVIAAGVAPVLVLRRSFDRHYDRVLFATNGTDNAVGALTFVTALLPDAGLDLVQAVQITPQLKEAMLRVGTSRTALTTYRDAMERRALDHLHSLCARVEGTSVTTRILRGDPATSLIRATRDVDLIAVGPGRSSLIRRAFIGSVTRRLLRDAACDVLICHATQNDRELLAHR